MKNALKRLGAYFIDLVIVYLVSAFISSFIIAGTYYDKYLNTYNDYVDFINIYEGFFKDFKNYYSDNNITEDEYNKLNSSYKEVAVGLEEAYSDKKINKKEYNDIFDDTNEVYMDSAIHKQYKLSKTNIVNTIVTIVMMVFYFVIVQYWRRGQTFGKSILKIKVYSQDGDRPSLNSLMLRSLIITDIIWSLIRVYCLYNMDAYGYNNASFILNNIMYLILFISLLFVVYRKDHKSLQDLFAGTKVVIDR